MSDTEKSKASAEDDGLTQTASAPLVFISHDSRDAELAEAFGKLLKSVSSGMIKSFRSSDKKGNEGIDFGDEWYKRLMSKLQSTSDVVCLFTERSLDRPWILFEAGVAKGKLNTPVVGIALGVSLGRISTGPFYQFQNMDDSENDLTKLMHQLSRRIPGLEIDVDVVKAQVAAFKTSESEILKRLNAPAPKNAKAEIDDSPIAKLIEEMKSLPTRVTERLMEGGQPFRQRRFRRFHPVMLEDMLHAVGEPGDPVVILMAASMIRDEVPWLYELAMEVYRAAKSENPAAIKREAVRLQRFSEFVMHGPFMEELGYNGEDIYMFCKEFPRMLEHMLHRTIENKKPLLRRRAQLSQPDEP